MAEEPIFTTKIPPGGKRGQALTKASDKDYYVKWSNLGGGAGGSCDCEELSITDIIKIMERN